MKCKSILILFMLGFGWSDDWLTDRNYLLNQTLELIDDMGHLINSVHYTDLEKLVDCMDRMTEAFNDCSEIEYIIWSSTERKTLEMLFDFYDRKLIIFERNIGVINQLLNDIEHQKTLYRMMEVVKETKLIHKRLKSKYESNKERKSGYMN